MNTRILWYLNIIPWIWCKEIAANTKEEQAPDLMEEKKKLVSLYLYILVYTVHM
jgi:hypothetical protein